MRILCFAGSNSSKSINKRLVKYVVSHFDDHQVELLDLNDFEMPVYSMDREAGSGIPEPAKIFAAKIDESDLLIVSLAEHNGAYSTAFKNIYDWVSRIKGRSAFGEKPMFLMAASPGKRGGSSVLEIAEKRFTFIGTRVLATFSLPFFDDNFNDDDGVINADLRADLEAKIKMVRSRMSMQI